MILVQGCPGIRLGFINAFLTNTLQPNMYDVGHVSPFLKLHTFDKEKIKRFNGKKIYIKLSHDLLFLHLFLFFEKNVLKQSPEFKNFHYTHRLVFDKLYYSSRTFFEDEKQTDKSLFDYVVPFEKTYNEDYLIMLYELVNGTTPTKELLNSVKTTNQTNYPTIPKNHAVRIAAAVFNFEYQNGYLEENRLWAVNNIAPFDHNSGECLDPENLFDNINNKLTFDNYK